MSNNALVSYGGGLVDCAKQVLMRIAENLSKTNLFDKIYIGQYSFESFYTPDFLHEYNDELKDKVEYSRGTIFGTCRDINLANPILLNKAIHCLKENEIKTIIIAGGDGSSRQVAEISDALKANGINIIFAIPLTVDGINGGASIGITQAKRESIRQIENIVSTSFETRSEGKFGVVIVELQGRNRDDIMVQVLLNFIKRKKIADNNLSDILLRVVPTNIESDKQKFIDEINSSSKKTLILLSEGSEIKMSQLTKEINRKVRTLIVGHPSQSNNMTTEADLMEYNIWLDKISKHIEMNPNNSYCLVNYNNEIWETPIDYYAINNPRENQIPEIDVFSTYWLKVYMSK